MERAVLTRPKPKRQKFYGSLGGGKPCPTCYAQMEASGSSWTCAKHGAPSKP